MSGDEKCGAASIDRCAAIVVYRERCTSRREVGSLYCAYHRRFARRGLGHG